MEQPFLSPYLCVHMAGMDRMESGSPYYTKKTLSPTISNFRS